MQRFCVKCGKETNGLISSLCPECYLAKNNVLELPDKVRVEYDYRSCRVKIGRDWVPKSFEALTGIVSSKVEKLALQKRLSISNLRVFLEPNGDNFFALAKFDALVEGVSVSVEKRVVLELARTVSDATTKLASNYFEATIQVRFSEEPSQRDTSDKLNEILSLLAAEKERNELSEAVSVKKQRKGFDVVVGSFKAADKVTRRVARRYKMRVIYSNSLFGVDDSGKNKYRHTYCLKFENIK